MSANEKELGFIPLTALIMGAMIGSGVFTLPTLLAQGAYPGAIIVGWVITGIGVISLGLVFQNLAHRKPHLDGGIYSYANDGFGSYFGFNGAWSYWLSCVGTLISYLALIFSDVGQRFIPLFGHGNNLPSFIGQSAIIWGMTGLILVGIRQAAWTNAVTTLVKVASIVLFICVGWAFFKMDNFSMDFWGKSDASMGFWESLFAQTRTTIFATLWGFVGMEAAVVFSKHAKSRTTVGLATVVGILLVLLLYVMVSLLALGAVNHQEIAGAPDNSLAFILNKLVGPWGGLTMHIALLISVGGAFLGWQMLCVEIAHIAAKNGAFPAILARENRRNVPYVSAIFNGLIVQAGLFLVMFASSTYNVLYTISANLMFVPYVFCAVYQIKLVVGADDSYQGESAGVRGKDLLFGVLATIYAFWLLYAAGLNYSYLSCLLLLPGLAFYFAAARKRVVFSAAEVVLLFVLAVGFVYTLYRMLAGTFSL